MIFAFIGNIGTWELLLILLVALIAFGPGKLPEVAKTIGKTLGEIKRVTSGVQKEFQDAINLEADISNKKSAAAGVKVDNDNAPPAEPQDIQEDAAGANSLGSAEDEKGPEITAGSQQEHDSPPGDAAEMKS